jgi:drug/metabolite transporter (DMT)-like permease
MFIRLSAAKVYVLLMIIYFLFILDLILSIIDVEGNYFSVKAYAYTSLLSIMLLDAWSTPCVVILSIIFLKIRFHWSQYLAVLICLGGIAVIIVSDFLEGKDLHSGKFIIYSFGFLLKIKLRKFFFTYPL